MNTSLRRSESLRRADLAEIVMRKVQDCSWCPFKFNEIVTLEKTLQECCLEDARVVLLMRKLATGAIFVEPSRKLKHLSRDEAEKRAEIKLKNQATLMREETNILSKEIDYYKSKIEYLSSSEKKTKQELSRLNIACCKLEKSYENIRKNTELMQEQIEESFKKSIMNINIEIPEFIESVKGSHLLNQTKSLNKHYRACLLRLMRGELVLNASSSKQQYQQNGFEEIEMKLSYYMKCRISRQTRSYLSALACLLRDLLMVDRLYSIDVPEERETMKKVDNNIEYFRKPTKKAPKKVTIVVGEDNGSCNLSILGAKSGELLV